MFSYFFRIQFRRFKNQPWHSLINIFGLALGTASCFIIFQFVRTECSYDNFHTRQQDIYRIWTEEIIEGEKVLSTVSPLVLAPTLADAVPEIEAFSRYFGTSQMVVSEGQSQTELLHVVDADFLDMFDFPSVSGQRHFTGPQQMIVTESFAEKYLDQPQQLDQTIEVMVGSSVISFAVIGVLKDPPTHSSHSFQALLPISFGDHLFSDRQKQSWGFVFAETYVLVESGLNREGLAPMLNEAVDLKVRRFTDPDNYLVGAQLLTDIHLNQDFPAGIAPVGDRRLIYILIVIAFIILALAIVNFTVLTLVHALDQGSDVGIRKAIGARSRSLFWEHLAGTGLKVTLSLVLGFMVAFVLIPPFFRLFNQEVTLDFDGVSLVIFLALLLLTTLLSGFYPATRLSAFAPSKTLGGLQNITNKTGLNYHQILTGFQFFLSLGLISCTLVMKSQLLFLQTKDLGYDAHNLLVIPVNVPSEGPGGMRNIIAAGLSEASIIKEKLQELPEVVGATISAHAFGVSGWTQLGNFNPASQSIRRFQINSVDADYLKVLDIDLREGANFTADASAQTSNQVVINQALADLFKLESPLGKSLPEPYAHLDVVGVANDFHFNSLHHQVGPLILALVMDRILPAAEDISVTDLPNPKITVRLHDVSSSAMAQVKGVWREVFPNQPLVFSFLDDTLARQYVNEQRMSFVLMVATILALIIAFLGLVGFLSDLLQRMTKQIGVRMVLGATRSSLYWLIFKPFLHITLFSALLSTPVVIVVMQNWLDNFAYRIDPNPLFIAFALLFILGLGGLIVLWQIGLMMQSHPIKSLRSE